MVDIAPIASRSKRTDLRRIDADGSSEIYVVGADEEELERLTTDGLTGSPTWSPDGRRLAFSHDGAIQIRDADGENRTSLLSP